MRQLNPVFMRVSAASHARALSHSYRSGIDSLPNLGTIIVADSLTLYNRANGGRAARSFVSGGDQAILQDAYAKMKPGDYMLVQFGHNDEADCVNYPDRCTPIDDYKKYLGMYVDSVRSRGATPILITPMVRNAWPEYNTHDNSDGSKTNQQVGNFSLAMQQVAKEKGIASVDLTQRSIDLFNSVGDDATKYQHFRKVRSGTTLPSGCTSIDDGTHFQPNGAREMARMIYNGLKSLRKIDVTISDTKMGTVVGYSNGVKNKANTQAIQLTNDFRNGTGWYENDFNPTVKIEAKPNTGYAFLGWSGDVSGSTNPLAVKMDRSYQITATFADINGKSYTVSTRANPGGTITQSPSGSKVPEGSNLVLTAVPLDGWLFTGWTGDISDTKAQYSISALSKDLSATASFMPLDSFKYEAENSVLDSAVFETKNANFSGKGYVNVDNAVGSSLTIPVYVETAGAKTASLVFSNSSADPRSMSIAVNGVLQIASVDFGATKDWSTWDTVQIALTLPKGIGTIELASTTAQGGPNLDFIQFDGSASSAVLPKAGSRITTRYSSTRHVLQVDAPGTRSLQVRIISLDGKIHRVESFASNSAIGPVEIPLRNALPGLYFVQCTFDGQSTSGSLLLR